MSHKRFKVSARESVRCDVDEKIRLDGNDRKVVSKLFVTVPSFRHRFVIFIDGMKSFENTAPF